MYSIRYILLVTLLIVLSISRPSDGCRCIRRHPQEYYCNADYVLKGTPTEKKTDLFDVVYIVKNVTLFKTSEGEKHFFEHDSLKIHTSASEASCGIEFNLDREYLMTGDVFESKIYVHLCGHNTLWERLTSFQRDGFTSTYKNGCACGINVDYNDKIVDESKDTNSCTVNAGSMECYFQHSMCSRRDDNCRFIRSTDLTDCLGSV